MHIGKPEPKYTNLFVLTANGWYGDIDERFMDEFLFQNSPDGLHALQLQYRVLNRIYDDERPWIETIHDMIRWMSLVGINRDSVRIRVDSVSNEILPKIDALECEYYDENGVRHPVTFTE